MKLIIFLGVFTLLICNVYSTKVSQCEKINARSPPLPLSTSISNCEESPCKYKIGDTVWINMTFTTDAAYATLRHRVFAHPTSGKSNSSKHNYPDLHGTSICPFITPKISSDALHCFVLPGLTYSHAMKLDIKRIITTDYVPIHFAIMDAVRNKEIVCFEITIRISSNAVFL